MRKILCIAVIMMMFSCTKKTEEISADSIYNVTSKWERQDGKTVTMSDLKGKVLVTAMIFTSCKTACPKLTGEMKEIADLVGKVDADDIQYVLVSIDPENDTPEVMNAYLNNNHFDHKYWTFLRSSENNTRNLANIMAVKYKEISPMDFSHSNIISVYSKTGVLAFQKEGVGTDNVPLVNEIKKQLNF